MPRISMAWRPARSCGRPDPCTDWPAGSLPEALLQRLSTRRGRPGGRNLPGQAGAPADAADCVRTLKRLRYDRERAARPAGNRPPAGGGRCRTRN